MIMGKKGEISVDVIIKVVFAVLGFALVLFVIYLLAYQPSINREACHQSIVLRSTARAGFIDAKEAIPLKCRTDKICVSMSGEDCSDLRSVGDDVVRRVKVSKCKTEDCTEARKEILDVVGDSMIACHSMLGEGKLNFMSQEFERRNYGLICSRIVFDDQIKESISTIGAGEFYSHLERKQTGKVSYLEYLYPEWKNSKNSVQLFESFKSGGIGDKNSLENLKNVDYVDWNVIDTNQENGYAVIAQISEFSKMDEWLGGIGVGGAVAVVSTVAIASGVGAPVGVVLLTVGGTIAGASVVSGGAVMWYLSDDEFKYASPAVYPYDLQTLKDLGIYSFEIAP